MNPSPLFAWSWSLDGWIVVAGALCAAASALLGNFLVLRRMSLLGDAISHAVLPGLAAAFLITGERSSVAMFLGAAAVGLLTAVLTEWVHKAGRVDEGASMGVVFTSLFALGLVMIVRAADHVDLDPGCVLYGAIELTPLDTWRVAGFDVPRVVVVLAVVTLTNALFVRVFFKELRIAAFDPQLAHASGMRPALMHYGLMTLVAITAVASFEAVGNILVVAMLVAPPAAARLLTDRLTVMVILSVVIAAASAAVGHVSAIAVPAAFGYGSTNSAGMMALMTGVAFTLAVLFAPQQGVFTTALRRRRVARRVLEEDVLGILYRAAERSDGRLPLDQLLGPLAAERGSVEAAAHRLKDQGFIELDAGAARLTDRGAAEAAQLVRSHRLWESYLVEQAGVAPERIHPHAERLEHVTDRAMRDKLNAQTSAQPIDPHGQAIPAEAPDRPHGG